MKIAALLACTFITLPLLAQSPRINVKRAAYPYEVVDTIPRSVLAKEDRSEIARFLDEKQLASATFIKNIRGACVLLREHQTPIKQFAVSFDSAVVTRNSAVSSAYERMLDRLSAVGRAALHESVTTYDRESADLVAADVVVAAPVEAERMFEILCNKAMAAAAP